MIDVGEVYQIVRDLANKDQKGFVTPAVFNTLAVMAQQKVFNEMFQELALAKNARRNGADPGREKSLSRKIEEDLQYFVKQVQLNASDIDETVEADGEGNEVTVNPDGAFTSIKSLDIYKVISINVSGTGANVELVYDAEKANRILRSNLSTPTDEFPVALMFGNTIQVFPSGVSDVQVNYYRNPRSTYAVPQGDFISGDFDFSSTPKYSVIMVDADSGFAIQDPLNSRNFDLPESYKVEVVSELARLIGVRLRDKYLYETVSIIEKES